MKCHIDKNIITVHLCCDWRREIDCIFHIIFVNIYYVNTYFFSLSNAGKTLQMTTYLFSTYINFICIYDICVLCTMEMGGCKYVRKLTIRNNCSDSEKNIIKWIYRDGKSGNDSLFSKFKIISHSSFHIPLRSVTTSHLFEWVEKIVSYTGFWLNTWKENHSLPFFSFTIQI